MWLSCDHMICMFTLGICVESSGVKGDSGGVSGSRGRGRYRHGGQQNSPTADEEAGVGVQTGDKGHL